MRTNWWWTVAPALAVGLLTAGCGTNLGQGDAGVLAVVNSLEGASGATPDDYGGVLFSDVVTIVDADGGPTSTIFADNGRVVLQLTPRNPTLAGPSGLNEVTFNRYRVVYRRTDGGSAVPAAFELAVTFTVPLNGSAEAGFELVRHAAKQASPLAGLQAGGSIPAVADVTFFGRDQQDNAVEVTGSIGIEFSDFVDPD